MDLVTISFWVYTLAIMTVGVYSARYGRTTSADFFLANRGLGAWVAALSSSASAESGWVTLGLVGMAFKTGVGALWIVPGTLLAFLFNWLVVADRLRQLSAERQAITVPDVLATSHPGRGSTIIRLLSTIIIISMLTAYVAAQFNAAGKMFESTLDWTYGSGVVVGSAIVLIYTISGGFRAVAWTDVIQALFMIGAVLILPIVLVIHMGGPEAVWNRLLELDQAATLTHPFAENAGLALVGFLSIWLGIPLGYPGQPHVLVRFMATRDRKAVRRGALISTSWVFLLFTGAVMLGIVARAYYGTLDDPETVLPIAAAEFLPGVIAGIVIAAVLAAICSTADSQLLVSASAISHDLYVRIFHRRPAEKMIILFDRISVLVIGLIATAIAAGEVRVIFDFVLYAWAGLGAAFGPALILTLLWRRTNAAGVIAGMLIGFSVAIVWRETLHDVLYELVPAFAAAFLAVIFVSLITSSRSNGS